MEHPTPHSLSGRHLASNPDRLPPHFSLFLIGALLSNTGTWMQIIAEGWVVATLTQEPFWAGFVGFCNGLPILLLSWVGGTIADRFCRRRVLVFCQYLFMLIALVLSLLTFTHTIKIWHVASLSFLGGLVIAVNNPAYNGFLFDIVGKTHLTRAVSLNATQFHISRLLGPAIGGICLANIGAWGCFAVNTFSFLAVIPMIAIVPVLVEQDLKHAKFESVWASLQGTLKYVRGQRGLSFTLIVTAVTTVLVLPHVTLLPLYIKEYLHLGPKELGWMWASSAAGSVLITLGLTRFSTSLHLMRRRFVLSGALLASLALFAFANVTNLFLMQGLLFFLGACVAFVVVSGQSLLQHEVAPQFRGRVLGLWSTLFHGMFPVGNLLVGSVAQFLSIPQAWKLAALTLFVLLTASLVLLREP